MKKPTESKHVVLVREFESLKERLALNTEGLAEVDAAEAEARKTFEAVLKAYAGLRQARYADRRVIEAHLQAARELLQQEIGVEYNVSWCTPQSAN